MKLPGNKSVTEKKCTRGCTHPEPRVRSVDLPVRKAVVVIQHDHVLGGFAHRVSRIILDEAKVVRELQAAGTGAHEDDAWVLGLGEQRHEVLDARGRAGGVSGHRQGDDLADGPSRVLLVA